MNQQKKRIFTEQDFRTLLVNRADIEKALGLTIELQKINDEQYLEDYALYPELSLHNVICIFLGLHPQDCNAHQYLRYETIYNAIKQQVEKGIIQASVDYDINGNITDMYISHSVARNIATVMGYKWNVPQYKSLISQQENKDFTANCDNKDQTIAKQAEQIHQLQARITELEQGKVKPDDSLEVQKQERISQPQRDIFSLLVLKIYKGCESRNALFDMINAEMKALGIRTVDIQYPTFDKLIDKNLRINNRSPFPAKQR